MREIKICIFTKLLQYFFFRYILAVTIFGLYDGRRLEY